MKNLIEQLEVPRHNFKGETVGPSNLDRRAASTIRNLILIIGNNDLTVKTLQKDISYLEWVLDETKKNINSAASSNDEQFSTEPDPRQIPLFD